MALPSTRKRLATASAAFLVTAVGSLLSLTSPEAREFLYFAAREYGLAGLVVGLAVAGLVHNFRQAEQERERSEANARRAEAAERRSNEVEDRLTALLQNTVATLEARYQSLKAEAEVERQRAKTRIGELSAELADTKARLEKLVRDLQETKALYEAERRHTVEVEKVNEALQQINDRLTAENAQHVRDKQALEVRVCELEEKTRTLQTEVDALRANVELRDQVIADLSAKAAEEVKPT